MTTQRIAKTGYWRINPETGQADWIEGSFQPPKPETIKTPTFTTGIGTPLPPVQTTPDLPALPEKPPLQQTFTPDMELLYKEYQRTGGKLTPELWTAIGAPLRPELETTLRTAYPEMFDPTRSFGFTEDTIPSMVVQQLGLRMTENYEGFLQDLTSRVGRSEAENILRQFGFEEDFVLQGLDAQQQEQRTLNTIQAVMPETETIESFANLIETDWESFFETIRTGGMDVQKRQLLELIGFQPQDINEIAMRPRLVVEVDGVRRQLDIDLKTKAAFDLDGNYIGMYNPATREFTKASPRNVAQKAWDWLAFSSRQYWELGESALIGILPEIIYSDIPADKSKRSPVEKLFSDDVVNFLNETNRQQRENWRFAYGENKKEHDDWLRKNPDIQPSVQYQQGAFQNPELLKDPMYYVYELTNILPLVVATAAVGVATGGTGLPFFAISTGMMGAVEGGAVYQDLLDAGAPEEKAAQMAAITGGIIGSLESVGRIPLLKQISPLVFGQFKREAARELARQGLAATIKKFGTNFTTSMFAETLTEVSQEIIGNIAVKVYDENRSVFENVPDVAVKTAIATAGFSLLGAGVSTRMVTPSQMKGLSDAAKRAKGWVTDNKGNWFEAVKGEKGFFVPGAEPGGMKASDALQQEYTNLVNQAEKIAPDDATVQKAKDIISNITPETQRESLIQIEALEDELKGIVGEVTPATEVTPETAKIIAPEIVKALNVTYNGLQEGFKDVPSTMLFTDKQTRSTFSANNLEEARTKLADMRAKFTEGQSGFAANIRLEKYNEEVRPLISRWAETHPQEVETARRGVIPDEKVKQEAERLLSEVGGDLDKFRAKWKPGTAWNAEELVAIRGLLQQKTREVLAAQKDAAENNSTANLLKLELALREHAAIQEVVHGLTAEAGRALRSFRQAITEATDIQRMEKLLSDVGGRENVEKLVQLLSQIDINDPAAVNKFIQDLYKPSLMDYLTELFYNSILSGPKTHIVNSLSNTANAFFSPIERAVSALVDLPLAKIQGRDRARYFDEVPADIFGAIRGIPEGFRQWAYVVKNGISFEQATKWDFRQKAFKGKPGAVINFPSRMLEGADQLMKTINQRAVINAQSHRIAKQEGLKGQAFHNRIAELLSNPTAEMLKEANRVAEYRLFRQPPGVFGKTLMNLREAVDIKGFKPLRFFIPFIRTPVNLVKFGLERTPLGFVNPKLWQNVARKNPEAADQIARATIGSIGMAALTFYAAQGLITGAPPRDRAERDRFYREGKQPFAIRIGDFWVSYQRLEPFNQLLSQVAILVEAIRNNDKDLQEKITDAVNTFGQNFISQTYMSSVSDLMNALAEPERYAGTWFNRFGASMAIPFSAATRTAAQMLDRTVRDPDGFIEELMANIPGLSKQVQAKITVLGEDIVRKTPPWFPINVTPVEETILSQELERLKYDIGFVGKTVAGLDLTDKEQREYQLIAGQLTKQDLEKLMLAPEYWQASDAEREKMISKVVNNARDWARLKIQQKIMSAGEGDERVQSIISAIEASEARLGQIQSVTPEFSHEPPDYYTFRDLWTFVAPQVEGVGNLTIYPPFVKTIMEADIAENEMEGLRNLKLTTLNTDPAKGDTFQDYYQQWQNRQKITEEREIEAYDKKYPDAYKGQMSRREYDLLTKFNSLNKKEQAQFLEDNPELTLNPRTEWLRSNPRQNALLALGGQANLLTKEAYNEFQKLVTEMDIPDNALPEMTLPPKGSIDNYFKYQDMENKNSWEAQLMLAQDDDLLKFLGRQQIDTPIESLELKVKNRDNFDVLAAFSDRDSPDYIADERDRAEAIKEFKASNPEFVDDTRRIEAIEKGASEENINAHVEYMKLQDQEGVGSSSAEIMLYRVDNPEYNAFRTDANIWGEQALKPVDESRIPIWRIDVKYRKEDVAYDGLTTREARLGYLDIHPEYRMDRRRREAYSLTNSATGEVFPRELTESYVAYYEYSDKGFRRERFLVENPDFAQAMHRISGIDLPEPEKVPSVEYDNIYDEWRDEFDKADGLADNTSQFYIENPDARQAERDRMRYTAGQQTYSGISIRNKVLTGFGLAEIKREGYAKFVPDQHIDSYTQWRKIQSEGKPETWDNDTKQSYWFEDDWFLMENKDFYNEVYLGLFKNERKDFRKVPDRLVFEKYLVYVKLPHQTAKKEYRATNPDLEEWGALRFDWTPIKEQERREGLTPLERFMEGFTERQTGVEERLKALR